MDRLQRRQFLKRSATAALVPAIAQDTTHESPNRKVVLMGDGLHLPPKEYARLLATLTEKHNPEADNYSLGGCVADLEKEFAEMLGEEAAIFMPTGTLAYQLAIRGLCGQNHRVIVQHESHVYNDTGDACQLLSNLNLIPLAAGRATFTLEEVEEVVKRTASGRVAAKVGAISIESPVRRRSGEVFDFEEMKKIAAFAKANGIRMHLDGARLFLATPYTRIAVKDYTALFDTVYVSLYKYFNAASGAILAGPKSLIEPMYHTRRMFGSGLPQVWPFAVVASHYADGFGERFAKAVSVSEELIRKLSANSRFEVHRIPAGTNIFRMTIKGIPATLFTENLKNNGVVVRADSPTSIVVSVNESILQSSPARLESIFKESLAS